MQSHSDRAHRLVPCAFKKKPVDPCSSVGYISSLGSGRHPEWLRQCLAGPDASLKQKRSVAVSLAIVEQEAL
jgi:hypothetical protein